MIIIYTKQSTKINNSTADEMRQPQCFKGTNNVTLFVTHEDCNKKVYW